MDGTRQSHGRCGCPSQWKAARLAVGLLHQHPNPRHPSPTQPERGGPGRETDVAQTTQARANTKASGRGHQPPGLGGLAGLGTTEGRDTSKSIFTVCKKRKNYELLLFFLIQTEETQPTQEVGAPRPGLGCGRDANANIPPLLSFGDLLLVFISMSGTPCHGGTCRPTSFLGSSTVPGVCLQWTEAEPGCPGVALACCFSLQPAWVSMSLPLKWKFSSLPPNSLGRTAGRRLESSWSLELQI